MRCFVGLDIPNNLKIRLSTLQSGLTQTRWVDPEGFHLTLAFLGELDGIEMEEVAELLTSSDFPALHLRLQGVDRFGSGKKTRVLWAGVEPNPCLEAMASTLRFKLSLVVRTLDSRSFKPHVSLSRHCSAKEQQVAGFLGANASFTSDFFDVTEFHLYSSHLSASGAYYRKELSVPLSLVIAN